MGPFGVVDTYRLGHHLACLSEVGRTLQQEFVLENAIDALCQGILVAVIAVSHGAAQSMLAVDLLVVGRAILASPVRMVNQRERRAACLQRHPERLTDRLRLQRVVHVIAHNLARVRIGHQAQVSHLFRGGQVGDVGNPHLLRRGGDDLPGAVLEQIRMAVETVMAVRGLVVRPPGRHQQARPAQEVKQAVTPHLDTRRLERAGQQVVQLACPDPGLA
jgi:hypothetical protein